MRLCGKPTPDDIARLDSEHARAFIQGLEDKPRADFKRFFKNSNPMVIDLLEKLLVIDPEKRPNAEELEGCQNKNELKIRCFRFSFRFLFEK